MANFNKVLLMGNLTRDPELRYLPSQTAVVEFGLAVNRKYKGQDGTMKEDTCFVDCQAFAKSAETLHKYCKKGSQLFVDGRLTFDSWTAQDGSKRSRLRVTVENFQFLGSPNRQGAPAAASEEPMPNYDSAAPTAPNDDIPF
jgi:single-strand DNA-binding protein